MFTELPLWAEKQTLQEKNSPMFTSRSLVSISKGRLTLSTRLETCQHSIQTEPQTDGQTAANCCLLQISLHF